MDWSAVLEKHYLLKMVQKSQDFRGTLNEADWCQAC